MGTPAEPAEPTEPATAAQPKAPDQVQQPAQELARRAGPGISANAVLGDAGQAAGVVIGDTVQIKVTLPGDKPYTLEIHADDVNPRDGRPVRPIARLGVLQGVGGEVVFPWKATPLGVPVFRLRFEVSAGGQLVETRLSTVVNLFDWIDVSLADPDFVDRLAREGLPRPEVAVDSSRIPTVTVTQPRAAWADAVGAVEDGGKVAGGILFDDQGRGRGLFPHYADKAYTARVGHGQVVYADVKPGSDAFGFHPRIQPRTRKDFLLSTRLRLSIWADPGLFQVPVANPDKKSENDGKPQWVGSGTFSSAAIDAGGDKTAALDDFTMLRVFDIRPVLTAEEKKAGTRRVDFHGKLGADFWSKVVALCHGKGIQALAGCVEIIHGKLSESRFLGWLDSAQLSTRDITGLADELVEFLTADIAWDGVDFDIEHLTRTGGWSTPMRRNVQAFFAYLGDKLLERDMLLAIAGTSFIDHTHVQSAYVPATGSATGLPVTLAHLAPNILYRPMAYDNAYLGEELRAFHRKCVRFALSPVDEEGAGLYPGGFQLGVKVFRGTNNGPKGSKAPGGGDAFQGYMTGMPEELQRTCLSVLRPHRTGVILFAWGVQSPTGAPNWDGVVRLDEALNAVKPAPIPDPVDKKALDALVGAVRFPHATSGQPIQGPLTEQARQRLQKLKF